jgi:hypothetical protein
MHKVQTGDIWRIDGTEIKTTKVEGDTFQSVLPDGSPWGGYVNSSETLRRVGEFVRTEDE